MPELANDRERVDFALRTESDGSSFYEDASGRTDNKLARAAFAMLAKEEVRHAELIRALGKRLEGSGGPVETESRTQKDMARSVHTIYGQATEAGADADLDAGEAYKNAIELEKRIASLYFGYIEECDSDEAKHLFKVLHKEEQDHLALLEDMFNYITRPDEWFVDRDMVLLDGG